MNHTNVIIEPPVNGEWAIMNPPGHPKLGFDFLAVNKRKLPYSLKHLLPHLFATIPVTATFAWSKPVFAPLGGVVVACSDGNADRERTGMIITTPYFSASSISSSFLTRSRSSAARSKLSSLAAASISFLNRFTICGIFSTGTYSSNASAATGMV